MSHHAIPWHPPMSGRDPDESHRASTPLELFFDLSFVVAVAAAGPRSVPASQPIVDIVQGDAHVGTRTAVVDALMWVVGLLGLDAGTSVLALGVVVSLSVADHVRRTNRAAFSSS